MLTIETDVLIAAPPAAVWAALTDYPGYADWNPYLVRVEGAAAAGADIVVHSVPLPGQPPMLATVRVVGVEFPAMRWEGGLADRSQFRGDHHWVLAAEGDGTRLRHFEHFDGALAADILARHGDTIRAAFIRFNVALKARCETALKRHREARA